MEHPNEKGSNDSLVNTLRVAKAELTSGNISGKVFYRLSEGSVAFRAERPTVVAKVSEELRQALMENSPAEPK